MGSDVLATTSGVLTAMAFGSMCFFAGVMAPLVFTRLPAETSGPFIRAVFPWYYAVLAVCTALAALLAGASDPVALGLLAATALGFAWARQVAMPRINALRDRSRAGDAASEVAFERAHRRSVWLNGAQMVALLVVLVRML